MNRISSFFAALSFLSLAACSPSESEGGIHVDDAWSRATAPGQTGAAAYMSIVNESDRDVRLMTVESTQGQATLHRTQVENGMASMRPIERGIAIRAGETAMLQPQGDHVMLMGLSEPLMAGDTYDLTLSFEEHEPISVAVTIVDAGSR